MFDINPHYRHGTADSTPITDQDDPADRDIRLLIEAAERFRVSQHRGAEIVTAVEKVTRDWTGVAIGFGISPEGAHAMRGAFENPNRERVLGLKVPPVRKGLVDLSGGRAHRANGQAARSTGRTARGRPRRARPRGR